MSISGQFFTTEDISSLPVPVTKLEDDKSDHLGQLFINPEMIAKKIKKMKHNKSPPKLLKEFFEQISTPLVKMLSLVTRRRNMSFRMERSKHYATI